MPARERARVPAAFAAPGSPPIRKRQARLSCEAFVQAIVKRKTTPMPDGPTGDRRDSPIVGKLATLSCRGFVLAGINRDFASMQRCRLGSSQGRRRKPVATYLKELLKEFVFRAHRRFSRDVSLEARLGRAAHLAAHEIPLVTPGTTAGPFGLAIPYYDRSTRQFQGVNGRRRQTDALPPIGRLFFFGSRKKRSLPLAADQKDEYPVNHAPPPN
jgi:hypothetical protein